MAADAGAGETAAVSPAGEPSPPHPATPSIAVPAATSATATTDVPLTHDLSVDPPCPDHVRLPFRFIEPRRGCGVLSVRALGAQWSPEDC
jgi:hypothetical protein